MGRVEDERLQRNQSQETFDDAYPPPGIGRNEPDRGSAVTHQQRSVRPLPGSGNDPQPSIAQTQPHEEDFYAPSDQDRTQVFPPPDQGNYYYYPDQSQQPPAIPPNPIPDVAMHNNQYTPVGSQLGAVPMGHAQHYMTGQPVMPQSPMPFNIAAAQNQTQIWSSNLFDCMNDPQNAFITACFPCVTFGQIAEIVDSGHTTCSTSGILYGFLALFLVPCIMSCTYRTKMRAKYGLIESPAEDWIVHCFCEWCALCQEYRQLKHQGFNPVIGWLGNQAMGRQQNQYPMAAPQGQTMTM